MSDGRLYRNSGEHTLVFPDNLEQFFTASEGWKVLPLLLECPCTSERADARARLQMGCELGVALVVLFLFRLRLSFRLS